jgi:WD40 repeat protein
MRTNSHETNRLLHVLDAVNGETIAPGLSISNYFIGVSLSDDGKRLVTFGGNTARMWEVSTRHELSLPLVHTDPIKAVFFNRDGNRIVTRSGNEAHVWDLATGQEVFTPLKHLQQVKYAEFSPDGLYLVTCCFDDVRTKCYAQVWNATTGLPAGQPLKHSDGVLFASFSPDSRRVVTASEDFTAIVWDVATSLPLAPPLGHEHQVQTASFGPDGKWIVTASSDQTARVWNAETGDPLTPPLRHTAGLVRAKFLPDGRRIVTVDEQGTARIWDLPVDKRPLDDLIAVARLLSGNTVNLPGQSPALPSESLETTWQRLRTAYPDQFAISMEEIAAWHEFQASDSENRRQWSAAAFHLERLLSIRPGDQSLVERLTRARSQIQNAGN